MKDSSFKFIRERVIHSFLLKQNGSIHDLLVECNNAISEFDSNKIIGIRALEKQLKELKEIYNHPIVSYRPTLEEIRNKGYNSNKIYYAHKTVDIRKVKFLKYSTKFDLKVVLREDEKNKIQESFIILERFLGLPGWEWLDYIFEEGQESINLDTFLQQKISFEEDFSNMKGHFIKIKDSIINKYVLELSRKALGAENDLENKIIFHPAYLKIWKNKWYAFGYGESNKTKYLNFVLPIDKYISKINFLKNQKYIESKTNFSGEPFDTYYFKDIIGVTNYSHNNKVEKIILRFHDKEKFLRLDSKPPHYSWTILKNKNTYTDVSMDLKINPELRNLIHENSPGIEVLAPLNLRKRILKDLELTKSYYTNK